MKNLFKIVFLIFFINPISIFAQEFDRAPLPKVKSIVEWIQNPKTKKVEKGVTYHFLKNGKLSLFTDGEDAKNAELSGIYKYDNLKRIISKEELYGSNYFKSSFAYKKNYFVEEQSFKDSQYKIFNYVDKKLNIIEKKVFIKNYDSDYQYQLFERTMFTYKNGKLISEKHYNHWNVRNKNATPDTKLTTYKYASKTGKVIEKKEFDYRGNINSITQFDYDKNGLLIKETKDFLNGKIETTTLKYKNNKIWTEVFDEGNIKISKIYKNGKLIRKRKKWNGGQEEIIDYQYQFFK